MRLQDIASWPVGMHLGTACRCGRKNARKVGAAAAVPSNFRGVGYAEQGFNLPKGAKMVLD